MSNKIVQICPTQEPWVAVYVCPENKGPWSKVFAQRLAAIGLCDDGELIGISGGISLGDAGGVRSFRGYYPLSYYEDTLRDELELELELEPKSGSEST